MKQCVDRLLNSPKIAFYLTAQAQSLLSSTTSPKLDELTLGA